MNILLIQLLMLMTSPPDFPCAEYSIKCYPETVHIGDTFYVLVEAYNPYEHPIGIPDGFTYLYTGPVSIHMSLTNTEDKTIPLFVEEVYYQHLRHIIGFVAIPPKDKRTIGILAINIPPLEYLQGSPFWEDTLKSLPSEATINLTVNTLVPELGKDMYFAKREWVIPEFSEDMLFAKSEEKSFAFHQKIHLQLRPQKEMELITQWRKNIPQDAYLILDEGQLPPYNIPSFVWYIRCLPPWYFVRLGNRYPGDPNAPETWQGWKELEESITPSTMRDEIRLTRILIQYCDTKDKKVLDELKTWFDDMNEIQRVCMAKSIRDRAEHTYGTDLLPQFCEIYKTIREYDVVPIPESNQQHLRNLGLIE